MANENQVNWSCLSIAFSMSFTNLTVPTHISLNLNSTEKEAPKPRRRLKDSATDKADGLNVLIQKTKAISLIPEEKPIVFVLI